MVTFNIGHVKVILRPFVSLFLKMCLSLKLLVVEQSRENLDLVGQCEAYKGHF